MYEDKLAYMIIKKHRGYANDIVHQYHACPYYIDLAFPSLKAGIELDGDSHTPERDKQRDQHLAERGWKLLHIRNEELKANEDACYERAIGWLDSITDAHYQAGVVVPDVDMCQYCFSFAPMAWILERFAEGSEFGRRVVAKLKRLRTIAFDLMTRQRRGEDISDEFRRYKAEVDPLWEVLSRGMSISEAWELFQNEPTNQDRA